MVFQPAFDVIASVASGTKVTCVGFISKTKFTNLGSGFPSILYSV